MKLKIFKKKIDKKIEQYYFFSIISTKIFFIYHGFYTSTYKSGKLENTKKIGKKKS